MREWNKLFVQSMPNNLSFSVYSTKCSKQVVIVTVGVRKY